MKKTKTKSINYYTQLLNVRTQHALEVYHYPEVRVHATVCLESRNIIFLVTVFNDTVCFNNLEDALEHAYIQHQLLQ